MKKRLKTAALLSLMAVIVGAAGIIATASKPERTEASPIAIIGLNAGNCVTLGVAFAHLDPINAQPDCNNMQIQDRPGGSLQLFLKCLRSISNEDGTFSCLTTGEQLPMEPDDLKPLDLDRNQIHYGQDLIVFAFVNDRAPVRFITDKGVFVSGTHIIGKNQFCETEDVEVAPFTGDPDCVTSSVQDPDGVVVARIQVSATEESGVGHVTAIQEGIGYPMDFSVVGTPHTIQLAPLFAKDTIQTGATVPPATGSKAPPLSTDCTFSASVSGVLGAVGQAEKTVVIVKALDRDDNEVAGALLDWDKPFFKSVGTAGPPDTRETIGTGAVDTGGVALPQTPTVDLGGSLGIGFPQFVCGGAKTGDITEKVKFDAVVDPFTDHDAHATQIIHVLGPPASIALAADPPELDCNGTNTSKITATVTNDAGQPVANGEDVFFKVSVLGTTSPLRADSAAGVASSVLTPLRSAAATGVPVIVTAGDAQASILVRCLASSGEAAPPAGGGGAPSGGAQATTGGGRGTISGPDTGTGGIDADGRGALAWWPVLGLATAAMALAAARFTLKRR